MIAALPNAHASALHAHKTLHHRLGQLEAEHAALQHRLVLIEKAVRWLDPARQPAARERLRRLGLDEQPDSMQALIEVMENAA
jgi:hypothetical protein